MNKVFVTVLEKFALISLGIFAIVYVAVVLTPKFVEFNNKIESPARVNKKHKSKLGAFDFEPDEIKSIYDMNKSNNYEEEGKDGK